MIPTTTALLTTTGRAPASSTAAMVTASTVMEAMASTEAMEDMWDTAVDMEDTAVDTAGTTDTRTWRGAPCIFGTAQKTDGNRLNAN